MYIPIGVKGEGQNFNRQCFIDVICASCFRVCLPMEPTAAEGVIFLVFEAELGTKNSFNILCLDASKTII